MFKTQTVRLFFGDLISKFGIRDASAAACERNWVFLTHLFQTLPSLNHWTAFFNKFNIIQKIYVRKYMTVQFIPFPTKSSFLHCLSRIKPSNNRRPIKCIKSAGTKTIKKLLYTKIICRCIKKTIISLSWSKCFECSACVFVLLVLS